MNTLAYPVSAWSGASPAATAVADLQVPMKALFQRLQSQWQQALSSAEDGADTSHTTAVETSDELDTAPALIGTSQEGLSAVRECVVIKQRGRQLLTAVRTVDYKFQLNSWRVNADGAVVRTGTSGLQSAVVHQLDLVRASKFVVACRTQAGLLKLISWDVSNTGAIYRAGESATAPIHVRHVRLVALTDTVVLTAVVDRQRQFQLISWQLHPDGTLTPMATYQDGTAIREVITVPLPPVAGEQSFLTVLRLRSGQLQVRLWKLTTAGEFSLISSSPIYEPVVTQVDAILDAYGQLVTALRTVDGHLQLVTWQLTADQVYLPVFATENYPEPIRRQRLGVQPTGLLSLLTLPTGHIKLVRWTTDPSGALWSTAESEALPVASGPLPLCSERLDGNAPVVIGLPTAPEELTLTTWLA